MIRQGFPVEGGFPLPEALSFAVAAGFDFVELNMDHQFERRRIDASEVGRLADDHGVSLTVHLPYRLDPGSPHEHVREGAVRELEASLDAAATMGAERAVFHGTAHARPEKWPIDEVRTALYDSVRRVDAHATDLGVVAAVENLKTAFFDAGDFPDLFEATDAAGCLDTGHAVVTGQDGKEQATLLREHGDRIAHVHCNETRVDDDDEHLPVGLGRVDFAAIADAMVETGWSGTCTHECWGFDRSYLAESKRHFDRLLDAARE